MHHNYPKSISEAAELLDKVNPDWYNKVNLLTLNMMTGYSCILGQLYENYDKGMPLLFNLSPKTGSAEINDEIFGLKAPIDKWKTEINSRRTCDVDKKEEEVEYHDWNWAMKQMHKGKKVRRQNFAENWYYQIVDNNLVGRDGKMVPTDCFFLANIVGCNWELYQEPTMLSSLEVGTKFKFKNNSAVCIKIRTSLHSGLPRGHYFINNNTVDFCLNNPEVEVVK